MLRGIPKLYDVGGQAVIEGVMMRSPNSLAIAVRRSSGEIIVKEARWVSLATRLRFLRWPLFRGGLVLAEALHNGVKALAFAAGQADMDTGDPGHVEADPQAAQGDEPRQKELSRRAITLTMIVSIALAFIIFKGLPHFLTWEIGRLTGITALQDVQHVAFHLVDGAITITMLVGYMALISLQSSIRRVFEYHGAEHKSIFCYEAGLPLTVENARVFTRYHPRCGTSFLLIVFGVSIAVFAAVFPFFPDLVATQWLNQLLYVLIKLPLMFPIAGIAYEFVKFSARHPQSPLVHALIEPGLWLQHITTREPSDDQLEIALVSLEKVLWRERSSAEAPGTRAGDRDYETYDSFESFGESMAA